MGTATTRWAGPLAGKDQSPNVAVAAVVDNQVPFVFSYFFLDSGGQAGRGAATSMCGGWGRGPQRLAVIYDYNYIIRLFWHSAGPEADFFNIRALSTPEDRPCALLYAAHRTCATSSVICILLAFSFCSRTGVMPVRYARAPPLQNKR